MLEKLPLDGYCKKWRPCETRRDLIGFRKVRGVSHDDRLVLEMNGLLKSKNSVLSWQLRMPGFGKDGGTYLRHNRRLKWNAGVVI